VSGRHRDAMIALLEWRWSLRGRGHWRFGLAHALQAFYGSLGKSAVISWGHCIV
jgi:hypothetical protein